MARKSKPFDQSRRWHLLNLWLRVPEGRELFGDVPALAWLRTIKTFTGPAIRGKAEGVSHFTQARCAAQAQHHAHGADAGYRHKEHGGHDLPAQLWQGEGCLT